VRRRDYVWEIFAARGVPSVAVNWWTTDSQAAIFTAARGDASSVDAIAARQLLGSVARDQPRFATVYLPALDIILNRLPLDPSARLAASVGVLDRIAATVGALRARRYDVVLIGLPGEGQSGQAVIAATFPLPPASPLDLAPTLCTLEGFPPSAELPGRALAGRPEPRIASYGPRNAAASAAKVNDEYYQNLKSLGYIK
jgi:hypothetical protein